MLALSTSLLADASPAEAFGRLPQPKVKILKSAEQTLKVLGPQLAAQVPGYFNYQSHVLVYLPLDRREASELLLLEIPRSGTAEYLLNQKLSPARSLSAHLKNGGLLLTVSHDRPCETGMAPHPEWLAACRERTKVAMQKAQKRLVLVALPRKYLRRLQVGAKHVPPRP